MANKAFFRVASPKPPSLRYAVAAALDTIRQQKERNLALEQLLTAALEAAQEVGNGPKNNR